MSESAIESLAKAIAYPDGVPPGATAFPFHVDGGVIDAVVENGRLRLMRVLAQGDVDLAALAGFAAGRLVMEEATLAFDPSSDALVLWQELSTETTPSTLRRFFEVFTASCDWWLARVQGEATYSSIPEMMIRP